jgi:NYN domain-containing protein
MSSMTTRPRVALFIDAENASARYVPDYLKRCGELGKLTIARCYGGTAGLKKWEKAMTEHHITPRQTPPGANKENASDFALTIDVVSLLHRNLFDHAVIASSDADFMQLAIHIRELGKGIDGIGEDKAPKLLQTAFDKFTTVPAVTVKATPATAIKKTPPAPVKKPLPIKKIVTQPNFDLPLLLRLFHEADKDGPVTVQDFGKILAAKLPKGYLKGHGNLTNYLKKSGVLEVVGGIVRKK